MAKTTKPQIPMRAQEIDGPRDYPNAPAGKLRIQPLLPLGHPYLGITFLAAEFRRYEREPDTWYVEVEATIGALKAPYTLVLTVPQAIQADIVETDASAHSDPGDRCTIVCALPDGHDGPCKTAAEIEGCRCPVCNGRNDDPAGIHGRR